MNPIVMKKRQGLNALGALIRLWTLSPEKRPPGKMVDQDTFVMDTAVFVKAMKGAGAEKNRDFELRENGDGQIKEVALVMRKPNRLTILLPEPDALNEGTKTGHLEMPRFYLHAADHPGVSVEDFRVETPVKGFEPNEPAMYEAIASGGDQKETWETFLDALVAGYSCSQCK